MTDFEHRKTAFGERLRQLRGELSAKALAAQAGWPPHKQSKIENGRQLPTADELDLLARILHVDEAAAGELREERAAIAEQRVAWRQRVRTGYRSRQQEARDLEAQARTIRAVEFGIIPGLLQTADYAHAVLLAARSLHGGTDDVADTIRERMGRQQVLYEPGRKIELLVAEAALWHPIAEPDVMAAQLHRLFATIGTPGLRFGILPARTRLPVVPMHGYWILDDTVLIEDFAGERRLTDPAEVDIYQAATDHLWQVAAEGDVARAILANAASSPSL